MAHTGLVAAGGADGVGVGVYEGVGAEAHDDEVVAGVDGAPVLPVYPDGVPVEVGVLGYGVDSFGCGGGGWSAGWNSGIRAMLASVCALYRVMASVTTLTML